MRVATLDLTPELFVEFSKVCKSGPPRAFVVIKNPLPDDAEIVEARPRTDCYPIIWRLFIKSESFEDVPSGHIPPVLPDVVFQTIYSECSELVA